MKRINDLIRNALHKRLNINPHPIRNAAHLAMEIKSMTDKLDEIVSIAKPRLIMGGIRYGSNWTHEALIKYMQEKFDSYKTTGNYELLIDLFNFIAIEGELKTHPDFHFNPLDRKE